MLLLRLRQLKFTISSILSIVILKHQHASRPIQLIICIREKQIKHHYQPIQYPYSTSHDISHQQRVTAPEFHPSYTAFQTFQDSPSSAVLISQSEDRKRPIDVDKKVNSGNDSNKSRRGKDRRQRQHQMMYIFALQQ